MLPIQEKVKRDVETSFRLARRRADAFGFQWHQHPECELTLIESGTGQRFVGDRIDEYEPGDLVLLGPDLPHTWASHPESKGPHRAIVVQFDADWLEATLAGMPEAAVIRKLLHRAKRGLHFTGPASRYTAQQLSGMLKHQGMRRVIALLTTLDRLAHGRGAQPLASPAYNPNTCHVDARVERACRYIHDHVTEPITQTDAAKLIHMSGPAFSRFFKQRVGMTYSRYVHELRIGHACRLLLETDMPVTAACFASGFNNLSNFNRVFRAIKGVSPRQYRQIHEQHSA